MNTICLDFGNTRLKAAMFAGSEIVETVDLTTSTLENMKSLLEKYLPERSILSSVIDHEPAIDAMLIERTKFHRLTHQTKLNFSIPSNKPETVGADRLALMAAAVHYYAGKNSLIIALGSCITYNFINQDAVFLGGAISPGIDMRFRSMHEFTAKLPLAKTDWNIPFIGYDTITNLQSGVIHGVQAELDGIIQRYRERYGNFNVLLTGGYSAYFASQLKNKIFADHNFLFKGLYALSETNN